ncbi:MAG: hypothetical protein BWK75_05980 [Candidatus Altiarchaeales archaeon A3]|nr:MAG: hypothetical protein BWK75_05980 [Candidatus Altiarchaeales archaeon A3]
MNDKCNRNKQGMGFCNKRNASNKGGTEKGTMLFEFQILLFALSRTKNQREKQMLMSIYQKRKTKYVKIH